MARPIAYIVSNPAGFYVARYDMETAAAEHVMTENEALDQADDEGSRWDWGFEWLDGHVTFDGIP